MIEVTTAAPGACRMAPMDTDRFIVGASEDVEAEYSHRAAAPVTLLTLVEGEVIGVEGFRTIEAARADLKTYNVAPSQIEYV